MRVQRVVSAFILVLVLAPLMLLMRWGGEAKAPWSATDGSVRARLVSPRFLWRADEEVVVRVRIENRGDAPVLVPAGPLALTLRHGAAAELALSPSWPKGLGERSLEPGAVTDVEILHGALDAEGPGVRTLQGTLGPLALPALKLRVVPRRD